MTPSNDTPDPRNAAKRPAGHVAAGQGKKSACQRVTSGMPLLITVVVHLVLIGIAGAVVVRQNAAGEKKIFEAAAKDSAAKVVEHRLQVARRGGASGGAASPVSANRIFSTAQGAPVMPEMSELPVGTGGFGGFGGMGSGVGTGAGTGAATSLGGGTGLGGRGFMSLSFLGTTSQNVSKIVFVVDTSTEIMEPRKGGFLAFTIVREEIMRLVARLPPSARFNVVLYNNSGVYEDKGTQINLYEKELVAATSENKQDFFAWMAPVNARLGEFGPYSSARRADWRRKPLPAEAGVDPLFLPPVWARATQAALEMDPDVVYVITSGQGIPLRRVDDATLAKRRGENERALAEFEREAAAEGMNPETIRSARQRAYAKASAELLAANRKLVAAGRNPIVVSDSGRIFDPDIQAELRKNGVAIFLDKTGWTKKDGTEFRIPSGYISTLEPTEWQDFVSYFARLQRALTSSAAMLNVFLFVGPSDKPDAAIQNLTIISKRNGGTFQLLTAKSLEVIKEREAEGK